MFLWVISPVKGERILYVRGVTKLLLKEGVFPSFRKIWMRGNVATVENPLQVFFQRARLDRLHKKLYGHF
jgi:hypothetical protein